MSSSQKGKEEASHDWKTHLIPSFQPELDDILKRLGVSGPSSGSTAPLPRYGSHYRCRSGSEDWVV
jgi:hypothetical protein